MDGVAAAVRQAVESRAAEDDLAGQAQREAEEARAPGTTGAGASAKSGTRKSCVGTTWPEPMAKSARLATAYASRTMATTACVPRRRAGEDEEPCQHGDEGGGHEQLEPQLAAAHCAAAIRP